MTWTHEQIAAARSASMRTTSFWRDIPDALIAATMDVARDGLAANGGTMTAEEISGCDLLSAWCEAKPRLLQHLTTQGTRLAALEERLANETHGNAQLRRDLEARENETLRGAVLRLVRELRASEEERKRLVADAGVTQSMALRRELEEARTALARLRPSGQVDDAERIYSLLREFRAHQMVSGWHRAIDECLSALSRLAALARRTQEADAQFSAVRERARHEDSENDPEEFRLWVLSVGAPAKHREPWTPPEPSGAGETLDGVRAQGGTAPGRCFTGTCGHPDAAIPGHAERVAESSRIFSDAAGLDAEALTTEDAEQAGYTEGLAVGYDDGAGAMRAASIRVALAFCEDEGLSPGMMERLKAAIEGAAP